MYKNLPKCITVFRKFLCICKKPFENCYIFGKTVILFCKAVKKIKSIILSLVHVCITKILVTLTVIHSI